MPATRAEKTMRLAARKAPATIVKQNRGQPAKRKHFKAWTVSALLERYQDPRAILLEIAGTDTRKLAETMACSMADALAERRLCAQAVLPYVAQKLPAQVDMRLTRAINLNIVDDRQYQELVQVAADATDDTDTFSMQLLPSTPSDDAAGSERPATKRPLSWDVEPTPQRNDVTGESAVTPQTPAPPREEE